MRFSASRREFVKTSSAISAAVFVGGTATRTVLAQERSANERVRYACIGLGGKGTSDSNDASDNGDIVAVCDVDSNTLGSRSIDLAKRALTKDLKPTTYTDFRKLLETEKNIDAVTVSTPDHTHAVAAALAMKLGKACFCQKPLTHSVWEARRLQEIAKESNVATSMGNQGTANRGLREAAAVLKSGALGNIKECHVFTDRPVWPQGGPRGKSQAVPANLDWNLWLGPAPLRPFAAGYHTFAWRGWWDFGTGALGDMACHTFNMPYMGLDLADPVSIQAWCETPMLVKKDNGKNRGDFDAAKDTESVVTGHNGDTYPAKSKIKFEFPANAWRGPITVWWYDGGYMPEESLLGGEKFRRKGKNPDGKATGAIILGDKGYLYAWDDYAAEFMVNIGGNKEVPKVEYERSPGHFLEFHESVTGKRKRAVANFENYAGKLTETILLGNLAVWAAATGESKVIEWNASSMTTPNAPELAQIVRRPYRAGYEGLL
ncbi:Glucose--fructose oxidoreductase precursor [Caulifigura coniformis]|uniref:Glucose--fructose oxidoreductase n=1 Tax=Caulifigura coniformis TaxID=2527983 RepID=A0A517SM44_9PLAN|nr:Gfo/Idh/MocA family oxidoreductase [Caulifigura coniformis]QDT57191.1 Glucose--fructose oxidoreductase precursor [Caulifigura coniformis]